MQLFQKVRMISEKYQLDHINKGDIGYIIEIYDDSYCEVEFSYRDGTTYAVQAISVKDFEVVDDN